MHAVMWPPSLKMAANFHFLIVFHYKQAKQHKKIHCITFAVSLNDIEQT